jgi:hypothetical protein
MKRKKDESYLGKAVSFSQYTKWLNCPHQWKLEYIDGIRQFDQSIDTIFGTAIHETIQEWLPKHFEDEKKARRMDIAPVFKDKLVEAFKETTVVLENGKKEYLASPQTLQEYYDNGCEILSHVQKYAKEFFPTKGYVLIGCEVELDIQLKDGLKFIAFLDIVIHDTKLDKYIIVDLKTSNHGWYPYQKKDPKKIHQLLLYKRFYAQKFHVPEENIIPRFIILKKQIKENPMFVIRRLSNFEPAHGTTSMKKMNESWSGFINECFDDAGNYKTTEHKATPSESACKYCSFKDNETLCPLSFYVQKLKKKSKNKEMVAESKIDEA